MENYPNKTGLYNPAYEHDACGIGAIASIKGIKTHKTIKDALNILIHLEHRGGTGAEDNSGDGAGILIQIPDKFYRKEVLGFDLPKEGDYGVGQLFLSKNEEIRKHEIEFDLIKDSMSIIGFSAGGHLAASFGYLYPELAKELGYEPNSKIVFISASISWSLYFLDFSSLFFLYCLTISSKIL